MRQQYDQCGLTHIGGFTAHVRTGDHQHAGVIVQRQVVGDERRGQYLLDDRVAALHDAHARLADKTRAVQVKVQRALGEVAQHIQLGQGGGGVLQRRQLADEVFEEGFIQHLFPRQRTALGRQRLVFELLELRRDKAFGTFEGLATLIVDRGRLGLLARQFNEVAVHAVVADFQVGQAGTGFFAGFQTLKGAERFITPELKEFEDKALSAKSRALAREKMLYEALLEDLIGQLAPLQDTAAALAELDVLSNLAERALNLDLNCPRFAKAHRRVARPQFGLGQLPGFGGQGHASAVFHRRAAG